MSNGHGRMNGKVIIITGAGNGIGYAAASLFHEEGARIIAVDYSEESLKQWNDVNDVLPILADITDLEDIEHMITETENKFGRLDGICNIAGINDLNYPLLDTDDERWDRVMNIDLKAPFRIIRRALPLMIKNDGGSIVNIGSYAAERGNHGPSYTAAKAGLVGLSKSIAVGYGKQGIRCNVINPGGTKTNIGANSGGSYHPAGKALSEIIAAMPVNWYGEAEDIAKTCLFLCSEDSKHINGAVIAVDGGMACC